MENDLGTESCTRTPAPGKAWFELLDEDREGRELQRRTRAWLESFAGPRCAVFNRSCDSCRLWRGFDEVFRMVG